MARRSVIALLLSFLAASAAACGGGGAAAPARGTQMAPVTPPESVHTTITGGTPAQRQLLHQIVGSMGPTGIAELRIAPAASSWHPSQPGDVELDAALAGDRSAARRDSRGEWQAWMVGGAFRDRSAEANLPPVLVLSVDDAGALRLQGSRGPSRSVGSDQLAAVRRQVARAVAASGARLAHLALGAPDGIAIDLSVQTRRPAAFLKTRVESMLERLAIPQADGRLVEIYGPDGRGIFIGANSTRLRSGLQATLDPRYASCVSGGRSTSLSMAPPLPCPSTWRPPPSTPAAPLTSNGFESGGKALGTWNGGKGIRVAYEPGAQFGIGLVLSNPNGHTVEVEAIKVSQPDGALIRSTGARIQVPRSRTDPGSAGTLQAPYAPVPAHEPFSIRPGDWVGVGLHFRVDACDPNATFTITYRLEGKLIRHTYPGVPLRLHPSPSCIS